MESSDDYTESPATQSAKSPDKKGGKEPDAYAYFLNKQRAEKGQAPVADVDSSLSDSEEAKASGRAEDPGVAKIKADMAIRKAEMTGKKTEPVPSSPSASSESYTASPESAAAKKASPEAKKAPPAEKKVDAYDYYLKKDRAAKGLAPEEEDDSEISDSEESKELAKDPAVARMLAEAKAKKEAALRPKPSREAAPEPERVSRASSPSSPISESFAEEDIGEMEDDDLELSQTIKRKKPAEVKTIESSPAPAKKLINPKPVANTEKKREVVKSESDAEEEIDFDEISDAEIDESVAAESDIN